MTKDKTWLTVGEAKELLGYRCNENVSRLAKSHNVRTKPGSRKNWFLYNREDLENAADKIDRRFGSTDREQAEFVKFNTFQRLPVPQILISDLHCPFADRVFVEQMLRVKDRLSIGNLVIAGDLLDCCSFSKFYDVVVSADWDTEKRVAQELIKLFLKEFDSIQLLTGNHELRYIKRLDVSHGSAIVQRDEGHKLDVWQNALGKYVDDDRLRISIYPYAHIGETWMISHPNEYRKIPLSFAREQFAKTLKSQIVTHAHMSAWSPAPAGLPWTLIDMGCMFEQELASYKMMRVTTHHQWSESFVSINDDEWGNIWIKNHKNPVNPIIAN